MRSASTSMVSSSSELSKIAQEKATQGQPTLAVPIPGKPSMAARVQARPVMASAVVDPVKPVQARPVETRPADSRPADERPVDTRPFEAGRVTRVMARPLMGQAPASATPGQTTLTREEATLILQGMTETLRLADGARTTGWRCTGVDDATFYKGRALRERLTYYLSLPVATAGAFVITLEEADVADKILGCSNEATANSGDKTAWIVLGVIVVGAAVFFSVTSRST